MSSVVDSNGYIYMPTYKDVFFIERFMYPYPSAIVKLNHDLTILWEHIFLHKSDKTVHDIRYIGDKGILGTGSTAYFSSIDNLGIRHGLDSWVFLINTDGEIVWERLIADVDSTFASTTFHGQYYNDRYYFAGQISIMLPIPDPYINKISTWLLSLDNNGCWNSDCSDEIIIKEGPNNSRIWNKNHLLKIYPNPSNGVIAIEKNDLESNDNIIIVTDMNGKEIFRKELIAQKTFLNFQGYISGIYLVSLFSKGTLLHTHKLILN